MISVDISLIYQMIAFLVMLVVLNRVLFKPIMAVLEERKKKTEGTFEGALAVEVEIERGNEDFKKSLKDAENKAQEERAAIRQSALDAQKALVEETRTDLQGEIAKVKKGLVGHKKVALDSLKEEAPAFSKVIAEKMLERALPLLVIAFTLLLPTLAIASGGGEGGDSGMTWKIINFVVLVIGIIILWKKFLKGALETRAKDIEAKLQEAEVKRKEAEALLAEYKQKESGFSALISDAEARIKKDVELEKEKIRAEAAAMVEKLKEQARFTTEQEIMHARLELKKEAAELAVELAADIIAKEIRPDDQDRLVKTYIDKMRLN